METETNVILGGLLIALGLYLYSLAEDGPSALPGNIAFFAGVSVATWDSPNPVFEVFFYLAVAALLGIFVGTAVFIYRERQRVASE